MSQAEAYISLLYRENRFDGSSEEIERVCEVCVCVGGGGVKGNPSPARGQEMQKKKI